MEKKHSTLQHIFWLFSGSEISILKECQTDYNRHSNIGLAIFATTLIAIFTGGIAGYKLGGQDHLAIVILFGLLWGLLVFTIDRNMVLTLQKNPEKKLTFFKTDIDKQSLFFPVIYRVFLSGLIAFFISIPLELSIFSEDINIQMEKDKTAEIAAYNNNLSSSNNIPDLTINRNNLSEKSDWLLKQIGKEPPSESYINKKEQLLVENKISNQFREEFDIKNQQETIALQEVPQVFDTLTKRYFLDTNSMEYEKYFNCIISRKNAFNKWDKQRTICFNLDYEIRNEFKQYQDEIVNDKYNTDKTLKGYQTALDTATKIVIVKTDGFRVILDKSRGFIREWIALNNIENGWLVFFIWFIRVVFFVIELLPTFSKIMTPIGDYDVAYFAMQKKFQSEKIRDAHNDQIETFNSQLKKIQKEKELEIDTLYHDLVTPLIKVEVEKKIENWQKNHSTISDDFNEQIEEFIKNVLLNVFGKDPSNNKHTTTNIPRKEEMNGLKLFWINYSREIRIVLLTIITAMSVIIWGYGFNEAVGSGALFFTLATFFKKKRLYNNNKLN